LKVPARLVRDVMEEPITHVSGYGSARVELIAVSADISVVPLKRVLLDFTEKSLLAHSF
jgi:hypothetical protein